MAEPSNPGKSAGKPQSTGHRLSPTSVLSAIALLKQRGIFAPADIERLQVLAHKLSGTTFDLDYEAARNLLYPSAQSVSHADTSWRKFQSLLNRTQDEAIESGKLVPGERLSLDLPRASGGQARKVSFRGFATTQARARLGDLESVTSRGATYENPALPPELAGMADQGREPILLLTVNEHETTAVRQVFGHRDHSISFLRAEFPYEFLAYAGLRPIVAYRCKMGSQAIGASIPRTLKAIEHLKPHAIIAVGIAFGRKDAKPGKHPQSLHDVLISEAVQSYEPQRLNPDGSHIHRGIPMPASRAWLERATQAEPREIKRHSGLLLCGEKLVDFSEFRQQLNSDFPDNIGGDMEGAGVVTACHESKVDWIVIKGVSDWGTDKSAGSQKDKDAHQIYAALRAAQVAYYTIHLELPPPLSKTLTTAQDKPQGNVNDFAQLKHLLELYGTHGWSSAGLDDSTAPQASAHQTLLDWLKKDDAPRYFALLGEYGMGKTITCQRLACELLQLRRQGEAPSWAREPLYFDLRKLSLFRNLDRAKIVPMPPVDQLVDDLIDHGWIVPEGQPKPRYADVRQLIAQGALVILDGLDECLVHLTEQQHPHFVSSLLSLVADQLDTPTRNAQPTQARGAGARLLLSCRTNFFKTLEDQKALFASQHREQVGLDWYRALVLQPLSEQQIDAYLVAVLPGLDRQRVQDLIATTHNLTELAQRPITLRLLAEHIPELEAARRRGEPVNGATLYGQVANRWLERDNGKHHLRPEHKLRLMPALAAELWRTGVRSLSYATLHRWFHVWRADQPDLAKLYEPQAYDQTKLEEDLRTATFVARQDEGQHSAEGFRFAHSSLHEYFLARYLADAVLENRPADWAMPIPSAETRHFLAEILLTEAARRGKASGHAVADESLAQTLNAWRKSYRAQASELLLRYALDLYAKPWPVKPPQPLLAGFDLTGAQLRGWSFGTQKCLTAKNAPQGTALLNMSACNFTAADLRDACFDQVRFDNANFTNARLERAALQQCSLRQADFTATVLTGTAFRHCGLAGAKLDATGPAWRSQWVACSGWSAQNDSARPPTPCPDGLAPPAAGLSAHLALLDGHSNWVTCVAFSPDGTSIASASLDNTLRLWEARTGECLATFCGHSDSVWSIAFSPNGATIASASWDQTLRLWDVRSGECLAIFSGHSKRVMFITFSPDGATIASVSEDNTMRLWQVRSGECLATFSGHYDSATCVAFSLDGATIVSASWDRTLRLWQVRSGECLATFSGHYDSVTCVAFSPDGATIVSASWDRTLRLWQVSTGECLATFSGHSHAVMSVAFSPDGATIASASRDNTLRLWDVRTGECLATFSGHSNSVRSVAFSPDGATIASASDDKTLRVWDVRTGECLVTFFGYSRAVTSVAFLPDGAIIASASWDKTLRLWGVRSGECLATFYGHSDSVTCVAFSPDGTAIASASWDDTLRLWEISSGECLATFSGHSHWVTCVAFSPDGAATASASRDNTLRLWDVRSGECLATFYGHSNSVTCVAFAPDGAIIASASWDGTLRIWDVRSGECLATFSGHSSSVGSVAFSPDGATIASASEDNTLRIWEVSSGECLATFSGHSSSVTCVAFSPDGATIASASNDNSLRLWQVRTGECLVTFRGHSLSVTSVAFSPDGATIASASDDNTLRIWDVRSGECLQCHWASAPEYRPATATWRPPYPGDPQDGGELIHASGDAWRSLAWRVFDHPSAPGAWTRLPLQGYEA